MSWENWAQFMLRTGDGKIAAVDCGIYSFEGECWYSSNEMLEQDVIMKLLPVFNSNAELLSIMVRGTKLFFIKIEDGVIGFKRGSKIFVAVKSNICILVSEGEEPNTKMGTAFDAAKNTRSLLNDSQ
ncbi:uncharacterized protein LOC115222385 [Argonauta hians]